MDNLLILFPISSQKVSGKRQD